MPQPGARSRVGLAVIWTVVGLAMVAVPIWLAATRWEALLAGHPAMLATAAACLLAGLVALVWAGATLVGGARQDAMGDPENPRFRTPAQRSRRARWRIALAVPALLVAVLTVAALAYARPFGASEVAVVALRSDQVVRVAQRPTWYELAPARRSTTGEVVRPTTALVFVPGARVDPRAYAAILRPVAQAGFLVIVIKEPFGFAVPTSRRPGELMALHPEIRYWAVGGHSLGGVNASAYAAEDARVTGLLLYASYPASPITRADLKVTSISGTADGLATPAKIEESKPKLPATTTYLAIDGGVHAYFGDYGEQPGDGQPGIERAPAQDQIVKATVSLLASLAPAPRR